MADVSREKILRINTQGAESNVKSLKTQIRELKEQLAGLEKGTAEYDRVAKQLADTNQKQIEVNEAMKYSNKDLGATLSNLTKVSAGVVGAISSINGVMTLMGADSEEAMEAMKNIQAMMAIIQGLSAVDTAVKALNGLSIAFKGFNAAKGANALVTAASTTAQIGETGAIADNTNEMVENNKEAEKFNQLNKDAKTDVDNSKDAIDRETQSLIQNTKQTIANKEARSGNTEAAQKYIDELEAITEKETEIKSEALNQGYSLALKEYADKIQVYEKYIKDLEDKYSAIKAKGGDLTEVTKELNEARADLKQFEGSFNRMLETGTTDVKDLTYAFDAQLKNLNDSVYESYDAIEESIGRCNTLIAGMPIEVATEKAKELEKEFEGIIDVQQNLAIPLADPESLESEKEKLQDLLELQAKQKAQTAELFEQAELRKKQQADLRRKIDETTVAENKNTTATEENTVAAEKNTVAHQKEAGAIDDVGKAAGKAKKSFGAWGIIITIAITAITALISHLKKLKEEAKVTFSQLEEVEMNANTQTQEAIGHYRLLRNSFVKAKKAGEDMTKWVKDHTEKLKALNLENLNLNQYEDIFINKTDAYLTALTKRYKAQWKLKAVEEKYIENLKDISRWHDLAYKIGINDYMNHWDDEYTIDGITRTVEEWQKASMTAFTNNQQIDQDIEGLVKDVEDATDELKKFGITFTTTTTTSKRSLKEILVDFKELWKQNLSTIFNANDAGRMFNGLYSETETMLDKIKQIIKSSNLGNALSEEFKGALENNTLTKDDRFALNFKFVFDNDELTKLENELVKEQELLTQYVNNEIKVSEEELAKQREKVNKLKEEVDARIQLMKAVLDYTKALDDEYKKEQENLKFKNLWEQEKHQFEEYRADVRANNPFAEVNKTITETEDNLSNLRDEMAELAAEEERLKNSPQNQQTVERLEEIAELRRENEKEIWQLQNDLEEAHYQERLIKIQALYDEETKKAEEAARKKEDYNLDWGQSDNYNTGVDAIQNTLDMIDAQIKAVKNKYATFIELAKQNNEDWVTLEIERDAAIEELQRQHNEKSIELEQEKSRRRLSIAKTYVNAYSSLSNQIGSILSAEMERYDENSKEYKNMKYAQGVINTGEGVLAAFMSGIDSGIPAPWNLALAAAMAGLTLTAGIMQLNNIKNEKLGGSMPNTVEVGSEYDTLSYVQGAETLSAIQDQRVYVVESDITSTQNRVEVAESSATF